MTSTFRLAAAAAFAGALAACSDGGSGPTARSQVRFNLATGSPAAAALLVSDTFATDTDTLVLDSVQLVLRDIKFQRVNEDACDNEHNDDGDDDGTSDQGPGDNLVRPASLHDDGGEDDGDDGHSDACESFNAGPYLLDLPLGPEVVKAFSVAVDTGTYEQVRFKIHKPEDDSGDAKDIAFLAAHPEFNKISIRAFGTFNGAAVRVHHRSQCPGADGAGSAAGGGRLDAERRRHHQGGSLRVVLERERWPGESGLGQQGRAERRSGEGQHP